MIGNPVIYFGGFTLNLGEMEDYDFTGSVVMVTKNGEVIINRGSLYGVNVGRQFMVEQEGEQLIDPDTGEVLGESEGEEVARIRCVRVEEKIAYCTIVEGAAPARGAVVNAIR